MSTQILGTVGQAVGAAVGGPVGGFIGGQIASGIGSGISGTRKRHYEGARLEELAVQTSTYGRMIPMVFGSVRMAGNVIWSRPIKEVANTTTVSAGGKGGGGQKSKSSSTEYSYSVTVAIAICEGKINRIDRVWADAKLLNLSQGKYRIYKGIETQLPDPLIESFEGVGTTPAYRGLAYVVIEDFPLADYGNRIPNFTFEVTRRTAKNDYAEAPVESLVKSIMLIPGSGEFVYDTQKNYKVDGQYNGGTWVQNGYQLPLNHHTAESKANVIVALNQLQETFPNLEWVGVVVNWFGTTMNISSCEVWPCVEYQANSVTTPDDWSVAGMTRATARQIGNDDGNLRYGGTPDDSGLLRLLTELRNRGLKIFFYPLILMDVAEKPWRGLLTGSSGQVSSFFTKTRGYRNFILHYANLVDGKVDAFAIGSELRDLTKISSGTGVFPAVTQLMSLAASVKSILGSSVKVTYAADWSEYHHTDGGWHHLDPLWASSSIDMVGIDAYFPLTDAVQTDYDVATIQEGWTSGEGYDWYYTDAERTTKANLSPEYAWKNIDWWWKHTHVNPGGAITAWVPQSKPIWFTEYGFASVDGCANEPNVFVDSSSGASAYPRFSRGRVDFLAQRTAIAATEAQWGDNALIARRFLWTWDARPYPHWPDLRDVWSDGNSWVTGHWVQGKIGASHVGAVVKQIVTAAGLSTALLDTSALSMMLEGFILSERTTARAVLEQLMQSYFFSLRERSGKLEAFARDATVDLTLDAQECLPMQQEGRDVAYVLERAEDLVLPQMVEVHSLNRLQRYGTHIQSATRGTQDAKDTATLHVSLVLSEAHGRSIAEVMLADRWAERTRVELQLPMRYAALEVGDMIQLNDGANSHRIRVRQVQLGKPGLLRVKGVVDAAEVWDGYIAPIEGGDGNALLPSPATVMQVLDMSPLPGDAQDALTVRLAACGASAGWPGASIIRVGSTGEDAILAEIVQPATIGTTVSSLGNAKPQLIDYTNHVDVLLIGGALLSSVTLEALLNGANAAVIGNEVVQFANATLLSPGKYRLDTFLRGRLGTEFSVAMHDVGERFVLLDDAVVALPVASNNIGQTWTLNATTYGETLGTGTTGTWTIEGNSLKPFSPVHVSALRDGSNDVTLRWVRRARLDGDWRNGIDVPLIEQSELYDVRVMNGVNAVRSWRVSSPSQVYTAAQQISDFGTVQSSYVLEISQISGLVGTGRIFFEEVVVQ